MTTGEKIKEARLKAGLTQYQVGLVLGVCTSNISKYENDLIPVSVERFNVLMKIKKHYRKSIDDVFNYDPFFDAQPVTTKPKASE